MEKSDVLIAGAGPVGLYLAGLLEKSGLTVRILEEHERIGLPNHCSGLVSRNLDSFVKPREEWIEHKVSGAVFNSGLSSVRLEKPRTAAYVIDRSKFDAFLAEGLDVRLGTRAEEISLEKGVTIKTNKGLYKVDMLIGCDGANSVVAKHFHSRPRKLLMGVIGITPEENYSSDVEIIINKAHARDGFFWRIPRGRTTEYGLFSSNADFLELENFFKIKPIERRAGLIPLGPGKTYFERVLLVGDAASMSKPWSGGGLIYGLTAARIAAGVVKEAFQEGDFSEEFLIRYEKGWKAAFGRQIQVGMLGRNVFENMGDFEVQAALKCMSIFNPVLNGLDMDFLVR
ncbi:MAG TPA: NAD(P)/FAD-dependent oxidoreductase [archaeon]|nr:NAD(P)/FAD-dependent oxidoreductase [archaeon]